MTVEDAERCGGCLVQVSKNDCYFGGRVYLLFRTYREFVADGTKNYGCILKKPFQDGNYLDIGANLIELIPYIYPEPEYVSEEKGKPNIEALYKFGGKLVEYEGRPVYLRRICVEYDEHRRWHYMLYLQEYEAPNTVFEAKISAIRRYNGKQPEPVVKEAPPIVQRHKEKQAAEADLQDKVRKSQEQTLAYLKEVAV